MGLNFIGLVAAASTFFGVWFGHVCVRKIESRSKTIWIPTLLFAAAGAILAWISLVTSQLWLSTATGILGFTLLWDALEVTRQQNRVKHGHAAANPANPRHARLLGEYPAATTLNLLEREPLGRPVSPAQAAALVRQRRP